MKNLFVVLLTFVVGCTHTKQFSSFNEINSHTEDKIARIKLFDKGIIKGKNIHISTDSTYWFDPKSNETHAILTSQVIALRTINRGQGADDGFIIFSIFGTIGGTYLNAVMWDYPLSGTQNLLLGTIGGIIYGTLVGRPIGAIIGSKEIYYINPNLYPPETNKW